MVFFAPTLELEPTALRAARAALMILMTLALVATVVVTFVAGEVITCSGESPAEGFERSGTLIELNCVHLC